MAWVGRKGSAADPLYSLAPASLKGPSVPTQTPLQGIALTTLLSVGSSGTFSHSHLQGTMAEPPPRQARNSQACAMGQPFPALSAGHTQSMKHSHAHTEGTANRSCSQTLSASHGERRITATIASVPE